MRRSQNDLKVKVELLRKTYNLPFTYNSAYSGVYNVSLVTNESGGITMLYSGTLSEVLAYCEGLLESHRILKQRG